VSIRATGRRLAAPPGKVVARGLVGARTVRWQDHSRLFTLGDRGRWSVEEDAAHVAATARRLGFSVGPAGWARFSSRQSVFLTSHFEALSPRWLESSHRLATAYLHGRPGTPGAPEFDESFEALRAHPDRFSRVQVTHAEMHELVLSAGVPPERIHRIPIGVDLENFPLGDEEVKARARDELGLPTGAFVVGSFQKDGVGWGEGLVPKLVKGPDVLVASLETVRVRAPELVVLLTGPARGYVRAQLDRLGIPFRHLLARSRAELARAYHALDVYVIPSRQEGGPKGVLESMATGVPLVTARVGQAPDIVEHGRNGFIVDVEDVEAIADAVLRLRDDRTLGGAVAAAARATAQHYAYERMDPAWERLLDGFVLREGRHGSI
jgi:glycosyltransferase involved in cell wall biosynthesis